MDLSHTPGHRTDRLVDSPASSAAALVIALLLAGCRAAPSVEPTPEPPAPPAVTVNLGEFPAVDAALQEAFDAAQLTGLAVGVAVGSEVVYLRGFGHEDVANDVPVDPSATRFRWASVSKSLAGVLATQGVRAGSVDLDTSVQGVVPGYAVSDRYLPGDCQAAACVETVPEESRTITLRQLLHHNAGVQHYSNGLAYPVPPPALTDDPITNTGIAWALDYWKDAPLVALPGTEYSYSTFGFNLAGVALEEMMGARFGELVEQGIAGPLGMSTMRPDFQWENIPRRAVGYVGSGAQVQPDGDSDVSWKLPGGGFLSTGEDMTRYCAGLLGDALVTASERSEVLLSAATTNENYGLGLGVGSWNGELRFGHTGSQQKARTGLRVLPESDVCFTVMSNASWAEPSDLLSTLVDAWFAAAPD